MEKDTHFIKQCISLAEQSYQKGDNPYACIIVCDDEIICQAQNKVLLHKDVTNHAEILAMKEAQQKMQSIDLSDCTIYSNYEPCAMCSYMIRELKFKKVVFSVFSPIMGGYSRWKILQDTELSTLKPYFAQPPEMIAGLLQAEGEKIFIERDRNKSF